MDAANKKMIKSEPCNLHHKILFLTSLVLRTVFFKKIISYYYINNTYIIPGKIMLLISLYCFIFLLKLSIEKYNQYIGEKKMYEMDYLLP